LRRIRHDDARNLRPDGALRQRDRVEYTGVEYTGNVAA
jgi:hypothetical protein